MKDRKKSVKTRGKLSFLFYIKMQTLEKIVKLLNAIVFIVDLAKLFSHGGKL